MYQARPPHLRRYTEFRPRGLGDDVMAPRRSRAVEFWSGSTCPGKYVESLPLRVVKSLEKYKWILNIYGRRSSADISLGKPNVILKIEGKNDVCFSACCSITETARNTGLALLERGSVHALSKHRSWVTAPLLLEL